MRKGSLLRFFGLVFVGLAVISLTFDLLRLTKQDYFDLSQVGEVWFKFHAPSLNLIQAVLERYLSPLVWDYGFVYLLHIPMAILLIFAALICFIAGRAKRE